MRNIWVVDHHATCQLHSLLSFLSFQCVSYGIKRTRNLCVRFFCSLSRTRGLPKCNPFPIVAHTRVSIPKNESIHKIIVRPKYLHRRTIYCFDVWCCVGYYAKCLAHIIYIRSSNYYFSRIKSFAELLDFFFSFTSCALFCVSHIRRARFDGNAAIAAAYPVEENAHFNKASALFVFHSEIISISLSRFLCAFFFISLVVIARRFIPRFLYFCWCKWTLDSMSDLFFFSRAPWLSNSEHSVRTPITHSSCSQFRPCRPKENETDCNSPKNRHTECRRWFDRL